MKIVKHLFSQIITFCKNFAEALKGRFTDLLTAFVGGTLFLLLITTLASIGIKLESDLNFWESLLITNSFVWAFILCICILMVFLEVVD